MNFRVKSKVLQWGLWLCAAIAGLAVYVVLSRILYGSMSWNIVLPRNQRIVLPILALFWLFAWETRWDGVRREKEEKVGGGGDEVEKAGGGGQRNLSSCAAAPLSGCGSVNYTPGHTGALHGNAPTTSQSGNLHHQSKPSASTSSLSGEELYARARALKHQEIPTFGNDAEYLGLLGQSAAKGHAPAMAKLGEYAMRRAAWVEAYFWMKLAQRNGMHGLSPTLREIRKRWSTDGFPNQSSNVNDLFTAESGSIGRALLHIDSGHNAAKAKEFLMANHSEFL